MGVRPGGLVDVPLRPLLREIDADRGVVVGEMRWSTDPAWMSGPEADQEFTAASLTRRGTVLQPTHTEVLELDRGQVIRVISHPLAHSVHSAHETPRGDVVLSSAGNDSVLELDLDGALVEHHWLRSGSFEAAYPGIEDFRRAHHDAFKPHSHHPNRAFYVGEERWVTCFEQRACVSSRGRRIDFPEGIPHDGVLRGGLLWFTLVNGFVVAVDPDSLRRERVIDLHRLDERPGLPGWCRGIEVVGHRLFVGMSALRRTRRREVLRMLLRGRQGIKRPSRLVEIDLERERIVGEIELGNAAGGTIYGVLKSPWGSTGWPAPTEPSTARPMSRLT